MLTQLNFLVRALRKSAMEEESRKRARAELDLVEKGHPPEWLLYSGVAVTEFGSRVS